MVRKVRTPFQPNPVREVSESEYTDLLRQGVVLEDLTEQVEEPPAQPAKTEASKPETETKKPTPLTFSTRTTSNTTKEEQ